MPSHPVPRRFERGIFDAHLIHEPEHGTRLSFRFMQREEEELDRVAEDEFKANYQEEYKKACAEAEEKWYPYRAAEIFDDQLNDLYEQSEVDSIIKNRWSELRNQTRERYINAMLPEVNKALERRAMLEPTYETEWGFRVKSKGEQAIANALRFYTYTDRSTSECRRVTLLYEPLFRIPDENRVIIPDFAVPEYCLIIEYAGLEERNYKFGLFMKMEAVRKLGFPFVIIRPEDLADLGKSLNRKLKFYFDFAVSQTKPF
jgi:hypothetical protein